MILQGPAGRLTASTTAAVLSAAVLTVVGATVGLLAIASAAQAADWTVKSQVSQGVELNDNRALSPHSSEETAESISRLTVDATRTSAGAHFSAGADLSYRHIEGPGAPLHSDPIDNALRFNAEMFDRFTKYFASGSWRRQDAVAAQIEDAGTATVGRGAIDRFTVETGAETQITPVDWLRLSVGSTLVDFDTIQGVPYTGPVPAVVDFR